MSIFVKDPAALVDYAVDWAAGYLGARSIVASDWDIRPAGALALAAASIAGGRAVATLSGGVPGQVCRVTNRVRLSDGRSDERTLVIRVEDR